MELSVKNKSFVKYRQTKKNTNVIFALCGLASNNHEENAFRIMRENAFDTQAYLNKQAYCFRTNTHKALVDNLLNQKQIKTYLSVRTSLDHVDFCISPATASFCMFSYAPSLEKVRPARTTASLQQIR